MVSLEKKAFSVLEFNVSIDGNTKFVRKVLCLGQAQ